MSEKKVAQRSALCSGNNSAIRLEAAFMVSGEKANLVFVRSAGRYSSITSIGGRGVLNRSVNVDLILQTRVRNNYITAKRRLQVVNR